MKIIILLTSFIIGIAVAGQHNGVGHDNAHYKFEYGVHDPHTHDHKSQLEHRDGKHAIGGYTLKEADGTHRIVSYKSGPHKGFEAVVARVGYAQHPAHYGKHGKHGHEASGKGGTSYVGVTHWINQGSDGTGQENGGKGDSGHRDGVHDNQGGHGRHDGHGHGGLIGHGYGGQGGLGGHGHGEQGGQGGHGYGGQGGHGGHGHVY